MEILISTISGIATGLGLGGGTILIIILTIFGGIEQKTAQATNLLFFIPTAVTSTIINSKNKNIKWNVSCYTSIGTVIGSIIGAFIATMIEVKKLKKLFGIFLAIVCVYEIILFYRKYFKK
jgi:hypothetical protein